jgi:hypothetical protein
MGFLDKAKAAAEQAATKAKETAGDLQTKRELGQSYVDLGRATFRLVEAGEVSSPTLDPLVEKIRSLEAQLDEEGEGEDGAVVATASSETPDPDAST